MSIHHITNERVADKPPFKDRLNIDATAHNAIGDVLVLEGLFQRIYAKFKGQSIREDPVAEMIKISSSPVLVPRMPFGKHKGLKMAEVPKKAILV